MQCWYCTRSSATDPALWSWWSGACRSRYRHPRTGSSTVLVYVVDDVRVVGYDNERGKGDHRHLRDAEVVYTFTSVEALLADFWRDVEGAE